MPRLIHVSCLVVTITAAFLVRFLPARWGWHLSAYDPYFQYRSTRYVVEHGFLAYFDWWDDMAWYPYGFSIGQTRYPALPFTAAFFYMIITGLGASFSLYKFCAIFPVFAGAASCLALYFFARDIGGPDTGLLAAIFLAMYASHIRRTSFGFFDDETVGVIVLILLSFLFLRSIKPNIGMRSRLSYAASSGVALGYLITEWGAHRYGLDLLGLFMVLTIVLGKYRSSMLPPYLMTIGVAALFALALPRHGLRGFTSIDWALLLSVAVLAGLLEIKRRVKERRTRGVLAGLTAVIFLVLFLTTCLGYIRLPVGKFLGVLNPLYRREIPIIESVAEHRPTSWDVFYLELGILSFVVPFGLYFSAKRYDLRDIYLLAYGLSSLYFAGSMVRILLVASPAICTLAAFGISSATKPFVDIIRRKSAFPRHLRPRVGIGFSLIMPTILATLILIPYVLPQPVGLITAAKMASSPPTIAASGTIRREFVGDWLEALDWIRNNTPKDAVIVSWWDYGYWLEVMGERRTLADNGTINSTQIAQIGKMFLSGEEEAVKILSRFKRENDRPPSHVVVFYTYDKETGISQPWLGGDNGKWEWMAKIADLDPSDYFNASKWYEYVSQHGYLMAHRFWEDCWTEKGKDATIYKLMIYGRESYMDIQPTVTLENFDLIYVSSGPQCNGYVLIYEVRYEG